jgi:hypothetical protein
MRDRSLDTTAALPAMLLDGLSAGVDNGGTGR